MLEPKEFRRWHYAWFAITLIAFLSYNFWIFIILSSLLLLYISKSEQNKFGLFFFLLIIIPANSVRIEGLVEITYVRMLSLVLLLPFFISFKASSDVPGFGKSKTEKLMLAYLVLNFILQLRGTTFTDALRYAFYGFTDIFLPYFAASRAIKDYPQLKKVMIALVLACLVAGVIGFFELSTSWMLYVPLKDALQVNWGSSGYLVRDNSIRAMASLGHPITLGFIMMVGLGFYLFIAPTIKNKVLRLTGLGIIIGGLISALSRGPWVGTFILFLVLIASGRNRVKRFSILLIAAICALPVLNYVPGGEKVINLIPFVGKTDEFNVEYRQDLLKNSIIIIKRNPLFGTFDPKKEPEMEQMVQGEGIIDLVNTYLIVALYNGLVALSLLLLFYSRVLFAIYSKLKQITDKKSDEYLCGRILLSTMVAVLFTIATVSSIGVISTVYWSLAGLIFTYLRVATKSEQIVIDSPDVYPTSLIRKHP